MGIDVKDYWIIERGNEFPARCYFLHYNKSGDPIYTYKKDLSKRYNSFEEAKNDACSLVEYYFFKPEIYLFEIIKTETIEKKEVWEKPSLPKKVSRFELLDLGE